jgi:hypothetical protein
MKGISYLNKLGIDIVHGCQLRCIGCPNSKLRPKIKYMTVDDFDTILKNIDITFLKRLMLFNLVSLYYIQTYQIFCLKYRNRNIAYELLLYIRMHNIMIFQCW